MNRWLVLSVIAALMLTVVFGALRGPTVGAGFVAAAAPSAQGAGRMGSMAWAVVDRFAGDKAVVFFGDSRYTVDLPEELLPPAASEGTVLRIRFQVDRVETERRRQKMQRRLNDLQ